MPVRRVSHAPALLQALHALAKKRALVGVTKESAHRSDGNLGNAQLAYLFETGAPEINMPARPHLRPGVERVRPEITAILRAGAKAALGGRPDEGEKALHKAGLVAVSSVRSLVTAGLSPALAPATVKARQRRRSSGGGGASTTPLVFTGAYLQSITYVVR